MRMLVTADLHYNHPRSKALAEEAIVKMNRAGGDVLLVVGDSAVADGDALERCLSLFEFNGPKLFVCGNHELWTHGDDSYALFTEALPKRIRSLGWHWLETQPFVVGDIAIVGTVGWYDYSFTQNCLGIPRRFYEAKISPGAAARCDEFAFLFEHDQDIPAHAREIAARWNDGKFVKLRRTDPQFLAEILVRLESQLDRLRHVPQIVAAVHHLPFRELLPPAKSAQWDFAKAYLGSDRIGQLLLRFDNVRRVYCGHSHLPGKARIGAIDAVNIGSGYRFKTYESIDLPGRI